MKALGGTTLILVLLGWGCSSDDGRAPPCTTCVEPVGGSGGTVGTGGTSGSGGSAGFGLANGGNDPECGESGSTRMTYIEVPSGGSFCIDEHEATEKDYDTFKDAVGGDPAVQPPPCDKNTSWETILPETEGWPRHTVDWCDAMAFCAFVGKRLCGRIGDGGAILDEADALDPNLDEWTYACTNANTTTYTYGDSFVSDRCATNQTGTSDVSVVKSHADCKGTTAPFDRLYDMSGNVSEWTNACDVPSGIPTGDDICFLRGGNYLLAAAEADLTSRCIQPTMQYGTYTLEPKKRTEKAAVSMGIRCCKDPAP